MNRSFSVAAALLASAAGLPAQHHAHPAGSTRDAAPMLGTVVFPNSGSAAAQEPFLRGVALLHSFEYDAAARAFREAQQRDPSLALAYWGEALTYSHVLWRVEDLAASRAALARLAANPAARVARAGTEREKRFGSAVEAFFGDATLEERVSAYADSMRALAASDTADTEAAAFASHALMMAGYLVSGAERQRLFSDAVALAQRVAVALPNHPGATHYLIHLYDSPGMAQQGLAFARLYDKIAPDAEHALHMPSHIYLQLGMWDDVVNSNERAFAASRAQDRVSPDWHSYAWLQYGYLQQGRWEKARAMIDSAQAMLAANPRSYGGDGSFIVSRLQFQYASETGQWREGITTPRAPSGTMSERERAFRRSAAYWAAVDAAHRRAPNHVTLATPLLATADSVRAGRRTAPSVAANALVVSGLVARARGNFRAADSAFALGMTHEADMEPFVGPPERIFAAEHRALLNFEQGDDHARRFFASTDGAATIRGLENVLRLAPNRSQTLFLLSAALRVSRAEERAREIAMQLDLSWRLGDASVRSMLHRAR